SPLRVPAPVSLLPDEAPSLLQPGAASSTATTAASSPAERPRSARDDRSDIFSLERARDLTFDEPVHDLDLRAEARALEVLEHDALDDQVREVALDGLLRRDARDVLGLRVLLRVVGVQAVFVFDVDRALLT